MKKQLQLSFLFILLFALDQLSKYLFLAQSICNRNLAWSISTTPGVFYLVWIIVIIFLLFLLFRSKHQFEKISLAMVLTGGISNLLDRITHGCVVDFIDLRIWPVFNLADIYITMGVIMLIASAIRNSKFPASPKI